MTARTLAEAVRAGRDLDPLGAPRCDVHASWPPDDWQRVTHTVTRGPITVTRYQYPGRAPTFEVTVDLALEQATRSDVDRLLSDLAALRRVLPP